KLLEMLENVKYNKLNIESKRLQNIIKMICFRAETSFAKLLSEHYNKSIINSHADIIPDYNNNNLVVRLYSQATPRMNDAIQKVCKLLNDTKIKYPGTQLAMVYEIAT
ncbi:MAG: hypothetical protein DRJ09_06260, partial [Bacteroidetes bacterium]